jgi:hypothetical protein
MILEKRTFDRANFDIDCSALLDADEVISSVTAVTADQGGFTFGTPSVNSVEVEYAEEKRTVAAGKVIQVRIEDGEIPSGKKELLCTIRARFVTSLNPRLEATVQLRLTDEPDPCEC